ncbi:ABC transporter ATP-binding protein/permease [Ornithinimicrobium sp. Arc0846-15]|nr:ABC transporter ATP-binding protein/permease [Ornithinimicrobium laminariae]
MLIPLLRRHLAPYRMQIGVLLVLQLISTLASLYLPSLNGRIIDEGVAVGNTGQIINLGGVMLIFSFVQIAVTVAATYIAARTASSVARDLRGNVFSQVRSYSAREVGQFGAPTLISRSTNDVTQVQNVTFMALAMMVTVPIMMFGGIIMALREDRQLAWLMVVAVPLLAITVGSIIFRMIPQFGIMQKSVDWVNRVLREQITGVRVVRAFVREDQEEARFAEANTQYTGAALAVGKLMAMVFPLVMLILNGSTVAALWFGAHRIESGDMQIGALTAFMAYLLFVLMSVMMATFMATMIPRASVSAGRIMEVLDTQSTVVDPANPKPIPSGPVEVEFHSVEFNYPGAESAVLRNVSLTAHPGQTTAIVGSTGAGKSTAISLITRLYDVTGGVVTLNGVDLREASLDEVWSKAGIVPQKPYLFTGTVASNLRYGNPHATDEDLWEALRIAQGDDFVREMSEGLESHIAQGGTNVSGGQRQRLAIARALVKKPDVYIFDDSFSALDVATDARLRAALASHTAGATVIVVAQRVSTIIDADQIIVLEDGEVVGRGRHADLLESCSTYQEIVESQLTAEVA